MFSIQQFPDASRKRGREDDDDMVHDTLSFGEHRNKRLQCLPLRTSPNWKRWSAPVMPLNAVPYTLTPGDSDSEEQPKSHFSPWSSSPAQGSCQPSPFQQPAIWQDHDMDMMDIMSPPTLPQQLVHPDPVSSVNGRLPTPIQPNFAAQVRGAGAWGGPGPAVSHLNGVVNMGHMHAGFGSNEPRCVPRSMDANEDLLAVQNRRLPSPISEGEDSTISHAGSGSLSPPGMVLDNDFPSNLALRMAQSSLDGTSDMDMMGVDHNPGHIGEEHVTSTIDAQPTETTSAPATPSPGRKGHIRSRHTVNHWTWQPGMKKSFSIGYRADCEKCRLKVPGHFNHIIVS